MAGLALLPCPTLSHACPELWGTPAKRERIHWRGTPRASLSLSLSLSLLLLLSLSFIHCPIIPSSWPSQPLHISCSFPLLPIASPCPLTVPAYNPRPQICHFVQKHHTSHSMDFHSCKGPQTSAGLTPNHSLDWETEAQREELACLKTHCNIGILGKFASGTRGSGRTAGAGWGEERLWSPANLISSLPLPSCVTFRCCSTALSLRLLNCTVERTWRTFSPAPGMRSMVVRSSGSAARWPGVNHRCATWAGYLVSLCLCFLIWGMGIPAVPTS